MAGAKEEHDQTVGIYNAVLSVTHPTIPAAELAAIIGADPAISWRAGEEVSKGLSTTHPDHGFIIESTEPSDDSLESRLEALAKAIEPISHRFGGLPPGTELVVIVDEWRDAAEAGGRLPAACMRLFAELGADLVYMSLPGSVDEP